MTPTQLRQLSQVNTLPYIFWYIVDWLIVVGIFTLMAYFPNPIVIVLGVLLLGACQHAITVLGHEATHARIHKNRGINDFIANLLTFWPLGVSSEAYRKFHLDHHMYLLEDGDPELARKHKRYNLPKTWGDIYKNFLLDLTGRSISKIIHYAKFTKPNWKEFIGTALFYTVVAPVLFYFGLWWVIPVWFLAFFTSYWAIFEIRVLTEHLGIDGTHRTSHTWWQKLLFLQHNIGYHWEHHKWPSIPFYNLPKARELDKSVPIVPMGKVFDSFGGK